MMRTGTGTTGTGTGMRMTGMRMRTTGMGTRTMGMGMGTGTSMPTTKMATTIIMTTTQCAW